MYKIIMIMKKIFFWVTIINIKAKHTHTHVPTYLTHSPTYISVYPTHTPTWPHTHKHTPTCSEKIIYHYNYILRHDLPYTPLPCTPILTHSHNQLQTHAHIYTHTSTHTSKDSHPNTVPSQRHIHTKFFYKKNEKN